MSKSNNPYGFPDSYLPEATVSATNAPSTRTRRTTARNRKSERDPPRWFASDRQQAIADFLAFNYRLDSMLGIETRLEHWPYCLYKAAPVKAFLARCALAPLNE